MATFGYKIIGADGRESGAFDSDALVQYARGGYVQPQTQVFDPTVGQWLPASRVGALATLNAGLQASPYGMGASPYPYPSGSTGSQSAAPRIVSITIGVLVALMFVGAIVFVVNKALKLASAKQTIVSSDGVYALSIPMLWRQRHLHNNPNMVDYNSRIGSGVWFGHTTTYPVNDAGLDSETNILATALEKSLHGTLTTQPVPLTVGPYHARQFAVDDDGHDVTMHRYRKTVISTPDGIYSITLYTRLTNVDRDRASQDAIITSFHRVTPATPAPPQ